MQFLALILQYLSMLTLRQLYFMLLFVPRDTGDQVISTTAQRDDF